MDNNINDLSKKTDIKNLNEFLINPKKNKTKQYKECNISNLAKLNTDVNNNIKSDKINITKYIECYSNE